MNEDNKISSPPAPEPFIPERIVLLRQIRLSRWAIASIGLLVAWLAVGYVALKYPSANVFIYHRTGGTGITSYLILAGIGETVALTVPSLAGIGLVWAAFVRPQWSERVLFSAALIVTALFFGWGLPQFISERLFHSSYGDNWALMSIVAYGPWLVFAFSARKAVLAVLCLCALAYSFVVPVAIGYNDLPVSAGAGLLDVVGGGLLGAAIIAAGLAVAEKVGAQVFTVSVDDA